MTTRSELEKPKELLKAFPGQGTRFLCAVSGGLDSMCLLHFMHTWGREQGFYIMAAHFNHQLRKTAERDEAFVRDVCRRWGIPLQVDREDVRAWADRSGQSLEEAARQLRYRYLQREAERHCGVILTAHHADDNAETILLNLVRGTGLKGLTGIPAYRDGILRPFLDVTRQELAEYAAVHNIPHMEDETNADPAAAARNLLRLSVMPLLRELNPRAAEHMNGTARQLRELDRFLDEEADRRTAHAEVREGRIAIPLKELEEAPGIVQPRMLLRLFDRLGVGRKDIGSVHLQALLDMRRAAHSSERCVSLPHGVTAWCSRNQLILEVRPQALAEARLLPGHPLRWGDYTLTLLDCREGAGLALRERTGSEQGVITVAPCAPGDRLTLPETHGGSRSVKRLCMDRRIALAERDRLPAIYTDGRLAAVWRLGVDVEFLPAGEACRFVQIIKHTEEERHDK